MKNFIKENAKMVSVISVAVIGTAALIIGVNLGMNDAVQAQDNEQAVTTPWTYEEETLANIPDETTVPEETTIQADASAASEKTTTEATTTTEVTTTPEVTTEPEVTTTPETTVKVIEQTLAPVQTVSEIEKDIIKQFDTEVEPDTTTVIQTAPPTLPSGAPKDAEGIIESGTYSGLYYKYIDDVQYLFDPEVPFLGWMKNNEGEGGTIIMDVESNGKKYPGG